jgi:hypothetical protein
MALKKIKFLVGLPFFFFFLFFLAFNTAAIFAQTTGTNTTEFAPSFENNGAMLERQKAILQTIQQQLGGVIPLSLLNSMTGTSGTGASVITGGKTAIVLTKNLKLGMTDQEVLLLQKVLNGDMGTIVSLSGSGSPGNETTYFGAKTKIALIKFQNKYAAEVLIPNGLTVGTGYFGVSTRTHMNTLEKNKAGSSVGTVPVAAKKVTITSLEPTHGKDGTRVTIRGTGITRTANKIIAGGVTVYNATSTDGTTLSFVMHGAGRIVFDPKMPVASSTYIKEHFSELKTDKFPELKYPVCIQNDTGLSNCAFFTVDL